MGQLRIQVVDSHTEGEPTRVVLAGGPRLGSGPLKERLELFRERSDDFRSGLVREPRGSEVVVGALLLGTVEAASTAAVIFFNDVGYLGMCGHGTIGLVATLAHLGRIQAGKHRIETVAGTVVAQLHECGRVSVENVPSYRYRAAVPVEVPGYGTIRGDIAWGGNWFFLVEDSPFQVWIGNRSELVRVSTAIRDALQTNGITGPDGASIDHVELFAPSLTGNSSRNFVLCPGASFDRSPCGTGTSAKMACLYADGKLKPGEVWRQEGILGTVFEGTIEPLDHGAVRPTITGRAWITAEATLLFDESDPFAAGIRFK